jgi:dihydrofolate reductase
VAVDRNGLIGNDDGLPWRLPADLKRFRKLTTGKPIILGRKTLEQIGGPLKDRLNIVLTRRVEFQWPGCTIATSVDEALRLAEAALPAMNADEIMVIGGADVYRQTLPVVERLYLTIVEARCAGSVHFPFAAADQFRFQIVNDEEQPPDDKNAYGHRLLTLDRATQGVTIQQLIDCGQG